MAMGICRPVLHFGRSLFASDGRGPGLIACKHTPTCVVVCQHQQSNQLLALQLGHDYIQYLLDTHISALYY